MDYILHVIFDFIFDGIYILLQGMGAVVRWLCFLGSRKPDYLLAQKQLNAFVAVLVFASGIGLAVLINNY